MRGASRPRAAQNWGGAGPHQRGCYSGRVGRPDQVRLRGRAVPASRRAGRSGPRPGRGWATRRTAARSYGAARPRPAAPAPHDQPHERRSASGGCRRSPAPRGAQPALSSSATPDMVSTTTMPRRTIDCGTRGAIRLPRTVPGTEPMTSGMRTRPVQPVQGDVGDRGGQHQRDRLDQVGADQPHRRQPGIEHQQGDHDHRARADAGDADQQAAEGADEQRRQRPDDRVVVARLVAGRASGAGSRTAAARRSARRRAARSRCRA